MKTFMRGFKFNWAIACSVISALAFAYVSFLSLNFLWLGDVRKSIMAAIAISVLLWLMAFGIKIIKNAKRNFQRNAFFEIIALAIYIIVAIILSDFSYTHYFTVSDRKEVIKEKIVADIVSTIKMFDEYEVYANDRILLYDGIHTTAIKRKLSNPDDYKAKGFLKNGESDDKQKKRLIRIFKDDLMPAKYDTLKEHALDWLNEAKTTATDWKPIGLMNVINTYDTEAKKWLSEIKGYDIKTKEAKVTPSFDHKISFTSLETEFTERDAPNLLAIIAAFALNILLLFPYFFTYRNDRHSGLWNELIRNKRNEPNDGTYDL